MEVTICDYMGQSLKTYCQLIMQERKIGGCKLKPPIWTQQKMLNMKTENNLQLQPQLLIFDYKS